MSEIGLQLDQLDTPILWVDLEIMQENVATILGFCREHGVAWRPHTKGIKSPAMAHLLLDAGASGVTCAKLGEAEVMAAAGVREILIANQLVGAHKLRRLAALSRHADVIAAVDSAATLEALATEARSRQTEVSLVVELNIGMNRAGCAPGAPALALARQIHETDGLRLRGFMGWEGHTVAMADPAEKEAAIRKAVTLLTETVAEARAADLPVEIVSCGGSGSYRISATMSGVTEVQAGGGIFGDMTYQQWGAGTRPAMFVRTVVTSRPAADRAIVDVGFKALPNWGRAPHPMGLENVESMSMSAEHGTIRFSAPNETLAVGDLLDCVPGYGDVTVFLHDNLVGVRNGVVEAVWPISARGKLR